MYKVAAKINQIFNIQLDLDFEGNRGKTNQIIETLRKKKLHQGFKKYMAQSQLFEKKINIIKNIAALPLIVVAFPLLFLFSCLKRSEHKESVEAVYVMADHPLLKIISERHARICDIQSFLFANQFELNPLVDIRMITYIIKLTAQNPYMLWHPYFLLFVLVKLSQYNKCIVSNAPVAIYSYNERSFVGPFITEYLNRIGIEHNLIMHGYRTYDVKDAFCQFNKMYVFGEYFVDMFHKLACRTGQYIMIGHPNMDGRSQNLYNKKVQDKRILFVLQEAVVISYDEISLFFSLLEPRVTGFSVVVKPKPNSPNWMVRYWPELHEERARSNSEALESYYIFAGKHSTYLMEAWARGNKVILMGRNALPKDMVDGPNVLRLTLDTRDSKEEKKKLMKFLSSPAMVDWNQIQRVFAKDVYSIEENYDD